MSDALLLDTNVVIWSLADSGKISAVARLAISERGAAMSVSAVSVWEIVIKHQVGRLRFPTSLDAVLDEVIYNSPWSILPLNPQHVTALAAIPMIHKDPFDRLLIAQAQSERLTLVTPDGDMARYGIPVLW